MAEPSNELVAAHRALIEYLGRGESASRALCAYECAVRANERAKVLAELRATVIAAEGWAAGEAQLGSISVAALLAVVKQETRAKVEQEIVTYLGEAAQEYQDAGNEDAADVLGPGDRQHLGWRTSEGHVMKMTHEEWLAEAERRFGKDAKQWKFVCPSCGHVASVADWTAAGATEGEIAFSCIGRRLKSSAKIFEKGKGPCNYAGGGLFRLNPVTVTFEHEGKLSERATFAFADTAVDV